MRYLSVCSGIEAATVAWRPLGWTPVAFSEIEKHPSAVLAHHYGSNMPGQPFSLNGVPNLGDMTKFEEWPDYAIDLLVGGTPCQDYSVAGLRAGMDGIRGSLTLTYAAIARRYRPRWVAWENVPGVFSSNGGRDFASFLGLLSGQRIEVPRDGWGNAGVVPGYNRAYGLAWRVLDAQYVRVDGYPRAVPQRRRRLFVVGYLGDWRRAAAVLLEPEGMRGNTPPSRKAGKGFARDVAPSLRAKSNCSLRDDSEAYVATFDRQSSSEYGTAPVASTVSARDYKSPSDLVALAFDCKASGQSGFGVGEVASTLRAMGHNDSHANGGGATAELGDEVAHALRASQGGGDKPHVRTSAVRRLTPVECERLQGFPDNYTNIPWGKKPDSPDGPRYKELGNSMAINCMRWIGKRIQMVEELTSKEAAE